MKSDRSDHYNCPVLTQRTRVKNEQLTRANVFFFFFYFSIWPKPVSRRRGKRELIKSLHNFESVQSVQTNHLWFYQQVLINVNLNPKRNHKPNQIQHSPRAIVQIITKSSWLCLRSFEPQIRLLRYLWIKKQPWDQCIRLMTLVNIKKLPDHWTCMNF